MNRKRILQESIRINNELNNVMIKIHKENLYGDSRIRENARKAIWTGIVTVEEDTSRLRREKL